MVGIFHEYFSVLLILKLLKLVSFSLLHMKILVSDKGLKMLDLSDK